MRVICVLPTPPKPRISSRPCAASASSAPSCNIANQVPGTQTCSGNFAPIGRILGERDTLYIVCLLQKSKHKNYAFFRKVSKIEIEKKKEKKKEKKIELEIETKGRAAVWQPSLCACGGLCVHRRVVICALRGVDKCEQMCYNNIGRL